MNLKYIIIALILSSFFIGCTEKEPGIHFEKISFEKALLKAKKQDKLIFIDFYTEWCAPCKKLAKGPFLDVNVGNFYNKNFISLKLDAEKEGMEVAKKYEVSVYPTLMFIDGDGKMVFRSVGSKHGNNLIGLGNEAILSVNDENSLENLQAMFDQKKNDEAFVKFYIEKMKEFGVSPAKEIEIWLNIQTEIKENSLEMLQYLLKNRTYLLVDGKAEQIMNQYGSTYLSLTTSKSEEFNIKNFQNQLNRNTHKEAYRIQDPELLRAYIDNEKEYLKQKGRPKDMSGYELDYLLLKKDIPAFRALAISVVDSIKNDKSIKQVKKEDEEYYKKYARGIKDKDSKQSKARLAYMKDKQAKTITKAIVSTGHLFLEYCNTKEDKEQVKQWLDYCHQLHSDSYLANNLEANLLYKLGQVDKAIDLKKKALEAMPKNEKKRVNVEHELELMLKKKELLKVAVKRR
jgi:thiol-disulfide isomerase/thioredoxin